MPVGERKPGPIAMPPCESVTANDLGLADLGSRRRPLPRSGQLGQPSLGRTLGDVPHLTASGTAGRDRAGGRRRARAHRRGDRGRRARHGAGGLPGAADVRGTLRAGVLGGGVGLPRSGRVSPVVRWSTLWGCPRRCVLVAGMAQLRRQPSATSGNGLYVRLTPDAAPGGVKQTSVFFTYRSRVIASDSTPSANRRPSFADYSSRGRGGGGGSGAANCQGLHAAREYFQPSSV